MWLFMTVLCCIWAFIASIVGDGADALVLAGAGVAFWVMSGRSYGDIDLL